MNRRSFLALLGGLAAAQLAPLEKLVAQQPTKYDVSYFWSRDIQAVLDYRDDVAQQLGEDVARDLRIVKGMVNFGLIYNRDGDRASTVEVAQRHDKILKNADMNGATIVADEGYDDVYNVSYGLGPNQEVLRRAFATVYTQLGENVGKQLVIERTPGRNYALVYRRRGTRDQALRTAERHAAILKDAGISATVIREQNNDLYFGESSYLNETIRRTPVERKPEARRPAPAAPTKTRARTPTPVSSLATLENAVQARVNLLRHNGFIGRTDQTAWSVYDFTTGEKIVSINEDVPMQSASMVKPLVALAYFHKVQRGELRYTSTARMHAQRMIQRSNNFSTNWMMRQVGGPREIQRIIDRHYNNILPQTNIVEYIPAGGRTYKNVSSAHDYSRFLYAVWHKDVPYASEIQRLMALPKRDRIYDGVPNIPSGTFVINKTGTTGMVVGDMGIIYAPDKNGNRHAYSMIGIIQRPVRRDDYPRWASTRGNAIRSVSGVVYNGLKGAHQLR